MITTAASGQVSTLGRASAGPVAPPIRCVCSFGDQDPPETVVPGPGHFESAASATPHQGTASTSGRPALSPRIALRALPEGSRADNEPAAVRLSARLPATYRSHR